jgi:L-alanine-DL-glutamate epimerase-like enolase superfamily enzyme
MSPPGLRAKPEHDMEIESLDIVIIKTEPVVPEWRPLRTMQRYPGSHRFKFAHRPFEGESVTLPPQPAYASYLRIRTAGNIETIGLLSVSFGLEHIEWEARTFKTQWAPELAGLDALNREYVWQKMWMARRYFHMPSTAPLALIDELLWDLAGLKAGMPVHKLLGGFRDRIPAYLTETGVPFDECLKSADRAKREGFKGFKDHSILGVEENIALSKELRRLVGDGFALMHDPVQQYTVDEAIKVGRALQDLGYLWIEEPLQEWDITGLKKLSDALDMHVMALESIPGNPYLAVPYLTAGAIDIVRQTGLGITGQMKLANLAEMFGLGCHGGNPHVAAAIRNDDWWEVPAWPATAPDRSLRKAVSGLIRDTHRLEGGWFFVTDRPGLGREIDWQGIKDRTVMTV